MTSFLAEWLAAIGFVLAESGPYLLVGFLIAGILKVAIPASWISRRMGGDDMKSVATASLIGVPMPLCSCSVIPTATQLRRSGASKGATTSFLISTPETGVDSISLTWALMDPLMTIVRPIAAFFTAFVSGTIVNGIEGRSKERGDDAPPVEGGGAQEVPGQDDLGKDDPDPAAPCCHEPVASGSGHAAPDAGDHGHHHGHHHGHDHDHEAIPESGTFIGKAVRYAFGPLLDDLAPWFVLGFVVSGLIVVLVPDDFFTGALGSGWTSMLVMLLAGIPLYVCDISITPVAAALMAKGLSPGAAIVLVLAGPATNVATILVVRDLLGKRALVAYLGSIAACSIALGAVVNALYPFLGLDPTDMDIQDMTMTHGPISIAAGAAVALLTLRSAWRQRSFSRFGTWLGGLTRPLGFDPTSAAVKGTLALALLATYASTAVSVVGPGETGFLVRFGKVVDTLEEPGLRVHAPWPITRLETVPTGEVLGLDYGFERDADDVVDLGALDIMRARQERERLEAEAEVVTRDEYLISVTFAVHVRVTDARAWRFGHEDPVELVGALSEAAMRAACARVTSAELLQEARRDVAEDVRARLQARVAALALGAEVVGVQLRNVHAPNGVHSSFRDVASAAEDRLAMTHRAREVATGRRAEADIRRISGVSAETADAQIERAKAAGSSAAFLRLGAVVESAPVPAAWILWLESLERAFDGRRVVLPLSPRIQIRTLEGGAPAGRVSPPDLFQDLDR